MTELTAWLGLASPVMQPIRTPWLSLFYQLLVFPHVPSLQKLYLVHLTAETFKFLKFLVNVGI
jgi:hypothetical protein